MCVCVCEENVQFRNEFLEGITSYLKSCNELSCQVTRHFELVTSYADIEFPGLLHTCALRVCLIYMRI